MPTLSSNSRATCGIATGREVIAGAKDPLEKEIAESPKKLIDKKYKALYRVMKLSGKEYVNDDLDVFSEMVRWMDSLDKQ